MTSLLIFQDISIEYSRYIKLIVAVKRIGDSSEKYKPELFEEETRRTVVGRHILSARS